MKITENVFYVGVDDKTIDLFEGNIACLTVWLIILT